MKIIKQKLILISIVLLAIFLRFHQLGANPPSLYWDEASLGYNAWSITRDLKDEHGDFLPLTNFKAFGDYKPPVYIYLAATSVKIFGLNEFAIRFPSAIFGLVAVLCSYFIVKYLIQIFSVGISHGKQLQLLSAFFLAISPWAVNLSRVAFEANVALGLFLVGLTLFLSYLRCDNPRVVTTLICIILIPLFFVLPLYTFNSSRIFIPLISLILVLFFYQKLISNIKPFILSLLLFTLFAAPLIPHLMSKEGQLRFQEVNIFTNPVPIEISNSRIAGDNNSFWSKIINNRRIYFAKDYLKHFTDNIRGDFLFLRGDVNQTFSTRKNGELYLFDAVLILIGIYFLWFKSKKLCLFLLFWLLAGLAPAGVARETPHALRTLNLFPVYQILSSAGLVFLISKVKWKTILKITFGIAISVLFFSYLRTYNVAYPKEQSRYFQYGYKELVEYINQNKNSYTKIFVSEVRGRPYIYFLLYDEVSENIFRENSEVIRNEFGFYNVKRFSNIYFVSGAIVGEPNTLTVGSPEEFGNEKNFNVIKKIKYLDGTDNFWIVKN